MAGESPKSPMLQHVPTAAWSPKAPMLHVARMSVFSYRHESSFARLRRN
jgi:hypothetical protein